MCVHIPSPGSDFNDSNSLTNQGLAAHPKGAQRVPAQRFPATPSRRQIVFAASAAAAVTALPSPMDPSAHATTSTVTAAAGPANPESAERSKAEPLLTAFPLSAVRLLDSAFLENMRRTCA